MFFSFLNDEGVYSKTKEEHWEHLQMCFSILTANGQAFNLENCVFTITQLLLLPLSGTMPRSFWIYLLLLTERHYNGF
jgi:hypothetical protein